MAQHSLPDGSAEAFRAMAKEFDSIYSNFAKSCGLSDAEFWSLLMIHGGAVTQSMISGQLFISKQTINSALKQLVKRDLVCLKPLKRNQRMKQIVVTPQGRQFMREHLDCVLEIEMRAWQAIEKESRMTLIRLMRKYCDLIQAALEQIYAAQSPFSIDLSL